MAEGDNELRFTNGAAYEQFMGPWSRKAGAVFLEWLAMPTGLSWLDIGCGTGLFTEMLLDRTQPAKVTGIDPAPAQVEHARSKPVARRAEFHVGDSQALPFEDDLFDAVASSLVFNFIPDLAKGVAEMRRVTKPGGWVTGYVWDIAGDFFVLRHTAPIRALNPDLPRTPGIEQSRLEALTEVFAQVGLAEVEGRRIDVEHTYPSFDDYWRIFLANPMPQSAFVKTLPAAEHEALRQRISASMPAAADGTVTFSARANAIKARVPG